MKSFVFRDGHELFPSRTPSESFVLLRAIDQCRWYFYISILAIGGYGDQRASDVFLTHNLSPFVLCNACLPALSAFGIRLCGCYQYCQLGMRFPSRVSVQYFLHPAMRTSRLSWYPCIFLCIKLWPKRRGGLLYFDIIGSFSQQSFRLPCSVPASSLHSLLLRLTVFAETVQETSCILVEQVPGEEVIDVTFPNRTP